MRIGLSSPIPNLGSLPGPSRPGWPSGGAFEFKLEIQGTGTFAFTGSKAGGGQNFSIDWGDGTKSSGLTGTSHTHTYSTAGPHVLMINNEEDSGPINIFQITSGETLVTKVLNWGNTSWNNLTQAFSGCTNLTILEDSALITDSHGDMFECFNGCTGLTTVNGKKWNLSAGARIGRWFNGCTGLEVLDLTGVSLNLIEASDDAFQSAGSATTNGCEFKLSRLTLTQPSSLSHDNWFRSTKIKPTSTFANIIFPSSYFNAITWFYEALVTGTNSTLNCSGWSTFNGTLSSWFSRLNNTSGGDNPSNTNLKVDLTNFSGKTSSINGFVRDSAISGLIGLSTWGATDGSAIDFSNAFYEARVFRIDANDNFSNTFISSCNVSGIQNFYRQTGNDFNGTLVYGAAPNLSNLNCSSVTSFASSFNGARLTSNPDFNSITYPSTAVSFNSAFSEIRFQTYSGSHIDFSNATLKISDLSGAFRGFATSIVEKLTFGDNVDFSQLTSFNLAFMNFGRGPGDAFPTEIKLPTNADYSSVTTTTSMFFNTNYPYTTPALSTCQVDYFIRNLYSSRQSLGAGGALTIDMPGMSITEAPSLVRSTLDDLTALGYNIGLNSTDAALPFAYPAYMVDPSSATSLTPSLLPPVADRNFSSTNTSMTIDQTTGVLSWASDFEGFTTVRCTYANGCYNEVNVGVQVPTVLRRLIPAGGQTVSFNLRGSQYVDWGDGTAGTNSGNASHTYSAAGTGWGTWRTIKIFDKSATEKFTGFNGTSTANYDRIDIMQWGSQVFDGLSFNYFSALGLRAPSNNPVNTTLLTSFYRMFRANSAYRVNARFADPNNNIGSWKTSTSTGGGAITSVEEMLSGVSMLGLSILDDHSDFTWSFPAGTTATAGTYTNVSGKRQSGTYVDGSSRWLIKIEGSGTVTLDNNNFKAIPDILYMGRELSVGDVIRIDVNSFSGLNNNITLTLTSDNILNVNENPSNLNSWDTSQITNFAEFVGRSPQTGGNRRLNMNFSNWNLSSAETLSSFTGSGSGNIAGLLSGVNDLSPKLVSAADSPTGSSYIAWDTSNITNFSGFSYVGSNPLGVLRYWRFSTTNNVIMGSMFSGFYLQTYASDEPCKTQIISASDVNNPYGVDYTAWNMEKVSSLSNFAYIQLNPGSIGALTPAFNSWQITDVLTSFSNISRAYGGTYTFTPNVGHWDISGISGTQYFHTTRSNEAWKFSISAYDNLLDIINGWGAHASTVNSGVTLNMGASQYSPGNLYYGSQSPTTYQSNRIYNGNIDLRIYVSVGDVVERDPDPNGVFDTYAIITGFVAGDPRFATTQGNIGPTDYKVMDSDAAKGRVALINAGWNINDGGAYIPFDSVEMTINVNAGDTFSITPQGGPNNFKVDWGDGNGFVGDPNNGGANYTGLSFTATSPAYTSGGNKTVKICEDSSQYIHSLSQNYNGPSASDKQKIVNINHWGSNTWKTFYRTFFGCNNLVLNTTTTPNLANGPSMAGMFQTSQGDFTNSNIGNWNMSSITDVSGMFGETNMNVDISGWDTSQFINMAGFLNGNSTFNQDISNWNTSNVTSMETIFRNCSSLNADLNTKDAGTYLAWDVSNVTNFRFALSGTTSMTYDIDKWQLTTDPTKSISMISMFTGNINWMTMEPKTVTVGSGAYQKTYLAWDTQRVTNMQEMFSGNAIFNKDIGKWDTSNVTNMYRFQRNALAFNNGGQPMNTRTVTVGTGATARTYTAWDVSRVTVFERGPFENNQAFNQDVSNWDVSNAANALVRGFEGASVFDHYLPWDLNTSANPPSTYYLYNMFNNSGMSTNNYTDTIVYWANFVKNQTPNAPLNVNMNTQNGMTFDSNRSGGSNFANALAARQFLTDTVANSGAGWTITGDTIIPIAVTPLKMKINVTAGQTWKFPYYNPPAGTSYHIDFGDGNGFSSTPYTSDATHTYTNAGDYIVQVGQGGDVVNVTYEYNTGIDDQNSIMEIQQWPENLGTTLMRFQRRSNTTPLAITATNIPDFQPGTYLTRIFANYGATVTDTGNNLEKWKMDNVVSVSQAGFSGGGWPSGDYSTKQVTYNGETYIAWNTVGLGYFDQSIPSGSNWQLGTTNTSLYNSRVGAGNHDLERKQVTVGTGSTAITYTQWDTELVTTWSGSGQACFAGGSTGGMNNYSVKNWIINYTLSNTSSFLYFGYPWNQAVGSTAYDNIWIGIAIGVYNGWESEKGTNYAAGYLTDLNVQMNANFNGRMNQNTSISTSIHPNKPSGWSTLADGIDYLIEEQGWTIQYT